MIDPRVETSTTLSNQLPEGFIPSPHSVIIGRSKQCKQAVGNRRLRILCSSFLNKYSNAINRSVKSQVVSDIVTMVRDACPVGSFIKRAGKGEDAIWFEVNESTAREKVGYVFRDLLGDDYRSSSKSKAAKRQREINKKNATQINSPSFSKAGALSCAFDDCMRMACSVEQHGKIGELHKIPPSLLGMKNGTNCHSSFATAKMFPSKKIEDPVVYTPTLRRQSDLAWLETMHSTLLTELQE
jgi:hypothetical protein